MMMILKSSSWKKGIRSTLSSVVLLSGVQTAFGQEAVNSEPETSKEASLVTTAEDPKSEPTPEGTAEGTPKVEAQTPAAPPRSSLPLLKVVSQKECTVEVVIEARPGVERGALVGIYDFIDEIKSAGRIVHLQGAMRMRNGPRKTAKKEKSAKRSVRKSSKPDPESGEKTPEFASEKLLFSSVHKGTLVLAPGASGKCLQLNAYVEAKLTTDVPQRIRPEPLGALLALDVTSGLHLSYWKVREETRATGLTAAVSAWAAFPRAGANLFALRLGYVHERLSLKESKKISNYAPSTNGSLTQGVAEAGFRYARFLDVTHSSLVAFDVGGGTGIAGSLGLSQGSDTTVDFRTSRRLLAGFAYERLLFKAFTLSFSSAYVRDTALVKGLEGKSTTFDSHGGRGNLGFGWRFD